MNWHEKPKKRLIVKYDISNIYVDGSQEEAKSCLQLNAFCFDLFLSLIPVRTLWYTWVAYQATMVQPWFVFW